ncbi:amidohydrolase family protein [Metallosphaera javensis (ex Sakai et al. 2022)]|uniref:amidohydrolase family protein n=1 Tax=Metallosphaera javensis (ex Sakai et al. 2022) TaxID=2775498 RepID=UPI0025841E4C|nr:MAG: 5-carboxyvanillate decarboxylase [Metallosphaera javensis (ex Sakai et al. 2022)]
MIIDSFTHINPPLYLKRLKEIGRELGNFSITNVSGNYLEMCNVHRHFCDTLERIKDMEKFGIDVQVITVQPTLDPNIFDISYDMKRKLSAILNDELSKIQESSNGKIIAIGTVAISNAGQIDEEEMKRVINDLGLKGFLALSHIKCTPVDEFKQFWDKANSLQAPIFLHPIDPCAGMIRPSEGEFNALHIFSWPYESALVIYRLASKGILEKYPDVKLVTHHLGGVIPFLWGRIFESLDQSSLSTPNQVPSPERVQEGLQKIYYDTAIGGNVASIKCALEVLGPKRLVFSTDYPWGPKSGRHRLETYPKIIHELIISDESKRYIFSENIRRILNI